MKTKLLLATLALAVSPSIALAMGCSYGKAEQVTMSCAAGTAFDTETQTCVPTTS